MKVDLNKIWAKYGKFYTPGLLIIFSLFLFGLMFSNVRQKEINIKEGNLASETIRANKTIENKEETEAKRKLASETVSPEFNYDETKAQDQSELIQQLFEMVATVNQEAEKSFQAKVDASKDKDASKVPKPALEDKVAALKGKFEKLEADDIAFYQGFPNSFYEGIFDLSDSDLKIVKDSSIKIVNQAMAKRIRSTSLGADRQSANEEIQYLGLNGTLQQLIKYIVDRGIVVNEVANDKKTEELRQTARANVLPVMIYQGEIVVREGVQIDEKAMKKLEILGLLNQSTSIFPMVSLGLMIVLQLIILLYMSLQTKDLTVRARNLTFYVGMMMVSVLVMKFLQLFQTETMAYLALFFPAAFTPLVLNLFVNRRTGMLAMAFQVAFSLFVFYDLVGTNSLLIIVASYAFTGSMATLIKRERIGSQVGAASLWLIIFPILFTVILNIYQGLDLGDAKTVSTIACAFAGSILSFLMSVGLHPYIELVLNDDSMIVLNELSNPTQPLLKQLLEEAPGTYHHSMMVASLSANAVAEIGGRSLLTRVACYYHDIGKLKHANFFVENLPAGAENPHNFLLPEDSKEIIFGHVTEGAKLLEKEKMPQLVIDICRQHHGTTLMKYFFVKAQERNPEVTEAEFRYPGPKPQTREAAVVNIADSAEAAVRAMDHPTNEKIKKFVHDLVQSRISDGQLDECGLTMKEIHIVETSIVNGLCSTFHSRIKYPKMKSEAEEMKQEQEERG